MIFEINDIVNTPALLQRAGKPAIQARDFAALAAPLFGIEENLVGTCMRYLREGRLLPHGKGGPKVGWPLILKDAITVLLALLDMPPAAGVTERVMTIQSLNHRLFTRRETPSDAQWNGGNRRVMTVKETRTDRPELLLDDERIPFDQLTGQFSYDLASFLDSWITTGYAEFVPDIDLIRHEGGIEARLRFAGAAVEEATGGQTAWVATLSYGDAPQEGSGLIRQSTLPAEAIIKLFSGFQQ